MPSSIKFSKNRCSEMDLYPAMPSKVIRYISTATVFRLLLRVKPCKVHRSSNRFIWPENGDWDPRIPDAGKGRF